MNFILYLIGIIGALGSFIYSFPFSDYSHIILIVCVAVLSIQYIAYYFFNNKKIFYFLSFIIFLYCLIYANKGFYYFKDVILHKYSEVSVYSFIISNVYNFHDDIKMIILTILIFSLPLNTLLIYCHYHKKYVFPILLLFPFVFAEILFTITPPFYFIGLYILFCISSILNGKQYKISFIPILLSLCLMMSIIYIVPPNSYHHPKAKENIETKISGPTIDNDVYDLMEQGDRYYTNSLRLRINGISNQSFKLIGKRYSLFNGNWEQKTSFSAKNYQYLNNVISLSQYTKCDIKTFKVYDYYHNSIVYTPYYYTSLSDTMKYYDSHFEGNQNEEISMAITNKQWNDYLNLSYEEKSQFCEYLYGLYDLTYCGISSANPIDIPNDTYNVLVQFMNEHDLFEDDINTLIPKAIKAIQSETEYSLKPGITPSSMNFFNYFLNINKKGYCVHYASTLALILQINGIQANFVTGYQVNKSHSSEDYINVLDSDAHAWVEIEDPLLGYIPIEATPVSNQQQAPAITTDPKQDITNDNQTTINNPTVEKQKEDIIIPTYIYFIIAGLLSILCIYLQSRIRYKKQFYKLNHNQIVCKMYYRLLKFDLLDDEFIYIFKKARYSKNGITSDEYNIAHIYYKEKILDLYKRNLMNRILFKIIYAYI